MQFRFALYFPGYDTLFNLLQKISMFLLVPVTGHDIFGGKLHWKCININPILRKVSKKRYTSLRLLYGSIDGKYASVSNTFMWSKMSSFHVVIEIILEPYNSIYIIGPKPTSAET